MRYVVAVHLGTLWTSASESVGEHRIRESIDGIWTDIEGAGGLIVIDGSLSDAIPSDFTRMIAAKLAECRADGETAARVWGCDNDIRPYSGWEKSSWDNGFGIRHPDQEAAARASVPFLYGATEILVTGCWATRDGASGCASSVAAAIRESMPARIPVILSESCLFEEYMDEPDEGDPEEGPGEGDGEDPGSSPSCAAVA